MKSLKVLSAAAAIALLLPLATPTASYAQLGSKAGGAAAVGGGGGGGGGFRGGGGGGGAAMGGGGFRSGGAAIGGGGRGLAGSPGVGTKFGSGPRFSGGGPRPGFHGPRHYPRRGYGYGGFGTGLVIGGALGSSYGYYGNPYGYGYYDDGYYYDEEPVVAVAPGGDAVEYCKRRFKSYDVRSGTYLGYDGLRHACP